jgi:hypothetical protein
MKIIFTAAFLFVSIFLFAQKKYDCVVITKNLNGESSTKFSGRLKSVNDSSLVLLVKKHETVFNWNEIGVVKFRVHNGFMRTVVPISLITYTIIALTVPYGAMVYPAVIVYTIFPGMPIYYLTRNHKYYINSYEEFLKVKKVSSKYIIK